jgi:hypothetical protein
MDMVSANSLLDWSVNHETNDIPAGNFKFEGGDSYDVRAPNLSMHGFE